MSHVTPTRRIVSHPPSDRVTFWIGTCIVHGAQQKQSCMAPLMGTPFCAFQRSASGILKRRETHVS